MFRVRIRSENIWRAANGIPVIKKLVRIDMRSIANMTCPENIDSAFSGIDLLSGVSKQTNKDRFAEVDELSVDLIVNRALSRIHDVGVSSGITSLELLRRLRTASFAGEMCISDKFARFWVNSRWLSTDIYDADRCLVCTYLGPLAGDSEDTWKWPISRLLFLRAQARGFDKKSEESFLLFHPDVLESIGNDELRVIDFDVFENRKAGEFDFIRCMNLLNLGYFPTDKIMNGLRSLHTSLDQGGILQLGRTHLEGGNHVAFYEKTDDGFEQITSIGDGSEIHQLVTDFQAL